MGSDCILYYISVYCETSIFFRLFFSLCECLSVFVCSELYGKMAFYCDAAFIKGALTELMAYDLHVVCVYAYYYNERLKYKSYREPDFITSHAKCMKRSKISNVYSALNSKCLEDNN